MSHHRRARFFVVSRKSHAQAAAAQVRTRSSSGDVIRSTADRTTGVSGAARSSSLTPAASVNPSFDATRRERSKARGTAALTIARSGARGERPRGDCRKDAVERLAQLDRFRERLPCLRRLRRRPPQQRARFARRDRARLLGPRHEIAVRAEVLVRLVAAAPADGVGEVEAEAPAAQVECVVRAACGDVFGNHQKDVDRLAWPRCNLQYSCWRLHEPRPHGPRVPGDLSDLGVDLLAIRVGVESIPPLAMMGVRCLAAGLLLYAWSRRSAPAPDAGAWRAAFIAGGLLFLGSHGTLAWAEQRVASGEAALLGATEPLWLALIDWRWGSGPRAGGVRARSGSRSASPGWRCCSRPSGEAHAGLAIANVAIVGAAIAWAAGRCTAAALRCRATCASRRRSSCWRERSGSRPPARSTGEWRGFSAGGRHAGVCRRPSLSDRVRLGDRLHRLRLAAAGDDGVAGRDARLREPDRCGGARRRAGRRARHHLDDACRR